MILSSLTLTTLHDAKIIEWKEKDMTARDLSDTNSRDLSAGPTLLDYIEKNHLYNYQLWHAEDRARRNDCGHEFVYLAKRAIDQYNQLRNDAVENIDLFFIQILNPLSAETSIPVHSETPGMIIDRLSILALKQYHMEIESKRPSANAEHRQLAQEKLNLLNRQRTQLMQCLDELLLDIKEKRRTFMMYYQFKMYNNKNFNPQLYENI